MDLLNSSRKGSRNGVQCSTHSTLGNSVPNPSYSNWSKFVSWIEQLFTNIISCQCIKGELISVKDIDRMNVYPYSYCNSRYVRRSSYNLRGIKVFTPSLYVKKQMWARVRRKNKKLLRTRADQLLMVPRSREQTRMASTQECPIDHV